MQLRSVQHGYTARKAICGSEELNRETSTGIRSNYQLFGAYTLHRALGLDRSLRSLARRRASEGQDLLVAILAARDDNIFGVDIFAEPRKFIRSDLIAASYHRSPAFYLRRHLSVGNDLTAGIIDEAEIARPVIVIMWLFFRASS